MSVIKFTTTLHRKATLRPPQINAQNQDLADITNKVWDAIKKENGPPRYFRYGGSLCRLEFDEDGYLKICLLTVDRFRHELAALIFWHTLGQGGNKNPAKPPLDVVRNVLATPNPPLPILTRITEVPVFAPDGTLAALPGYHDTARVYYSPAEDLEIPPVPSKPTRKDIKGALSLIFDDLFVDFPFVGPADRAHALALFLLSYARDLIVGSTPNHMVEGPMPGSGKDLLVDVCLRPPFGPGALGILGQATDEEEWRRRITACLKGATPAILIANVTKPLDSGVLSHALTTRTWSDRLLGKNEIIKLPVRVIWATTANNPEVSSEIARRSIRIRIDPQCDRPWERTDFKHPDLRQWADDHRGELIWAGLVLIQAWVAAGKPFWRKKSLGSFEHWTAVMGGILDVAGVKGFLDNLHEFYESAVSVSAIIWRIFVEMWWEQHGSEDVPTADLVSLALESGVELTGVAEKVQKVSLGMKLGRKRDSVLGDFRIVQVEKRRGSAIWRLDHLTERGACGASGTPEKKKRK